MLLQGAPDATERAGDPTVPARPSAWHRFVRWDLAGIVAALAVISAALLLFVPAFRSAYNLNALAFTVSVTGIVALAQLCVLSIGQFNLALTAIGAASGIFAGWLMQELGLPFPLAVLAGLAGGWLAGALQGWMIAATGINPFIVSLALAAIYFGTLLGLTKGASFNRLPPEFTGLGRAYFLRVPLLPVLSLVVALAAGTFFHRSVTGRRLLATGASSRAALMSGLRTKRLVVVAHGLSGLLAAAAALMLVMRLGSAQPSLGSEWLLPSFAAPVLGGTLLSGGKVRIGGAFLGALLLAVIANGLVLLGVSAYWYQSSLGIVLLAALSLDRARHSLLSRQQL